MEALHYFRAALQLAPYGLSATHSCFCAHCMLRCRPTTVDCRSIYLQARRSRGDGWMLAVARWPDGGRADRDQLLEGRRVIQQSRSRLQRFFCLQRMPSKPWKALSANTRMMPRQRTQCTSSQIFAASPPCCRFFDNCSQSMSSSKTRRGSTTVTAGLQCTQLSDTTC